MVVMMDMEISCKGHCEKLSHFLDHVSHTVKCQAKIEADDILVFYFYLSKKIRLDFFM